MRQHRDAVFLAKYHNKLIRVANSLDSNIACTIKLALGTLVQNSDKLGICYLQVHNRFIKYTPTTNFFFMLSLDKALHLTLQPNGPNIYTQRKENLPVAWIQEDIRRQRLLDRREVRHGVHHLDTPWDAEPVHMALRFLVLSLELGVSVPFHSIRGSILAGPP
uniref:Uncharacterized protein n=1 Tax=Arundo donax TaxID=35708 RepID=A0A0A9DXQ1_ARUDO